jgi:membrane protein
MKKYTDRILQTTGYRWVINKLDTTHVTKSRVSLLSIIRMFIQQTQKDHLQERASAMAFNFLMSVFPGIIFIFTLIPYVPVPDLQAKIMGMLYDLLPLSIYEQVDTTILDIISKPRTGLLSFGFIFALYAANKGTMNMITAFNKCYRTKDNHPYFQQLLVSLGITGFISLLTFSAMALSIVVEVYTHFLVDSMPVVIQENIHVIGGIKNILIFSVFFFSVSFIYYRAPAIHEKWNFFSIGSFVASVMIVGFTAGFAYYVNHFNSYNKVYGSIGALIGLMLWFYAISLMLLIGFEINASIHRAQLALAKERPDSEV